MSTFLSCELLNAVSLQEVMLAATLKGDCGFCRIASRGNLASKASDYGGLEVFGGASIGHTDPFDVIAAVDHQLAAFPPDL